MVVTLQRTRPPHGTHEREGFASGQDVNDRTVERSSKQEKRSLCPEDYFEDPSLSAERTFAASESENPGSSAICSAVALRTPSRLPKVLKRARWRAGPTPEIAPKPVVRVRLARRFL